MRRIASFPGGGQRRDEEDVSRQRIRNGRTGNVRSLISSFQRASPDARTRSSQGDGAAFTPVIPKTWDDEAVRALELPLADARYSPVQISSDEYYQMTVRPVYKSYPIYAPGKEPADYLEWLKQQEPEIVFDAAKLKTEADWIRAGELVFDAPRSFRPLASAGVHDPKYYEETGILLAKDGTMPFNRYVIRKKGIVEVGNGSCASCHIRVMPDGTLVKEPRATLPLTGSWPSNSGNERLDPMTRVSKHWRTSAPSRACSSVLRGFTRTRRKSFSPWMNSGPPGKRFHPE